MQMSLFGAGGGPGPVEEALNELSPDTLSPLEALQALYRLKKLAAGQEQEN